MKLSFDLHLHSCLSPCGGEDNTPANLAAMCALAGLDVVALTDHNTCGNCRSFAAAAEANGLLAIPGMELTTAEEIHTVLLFPDCDRAEECSALVRTKLPPIQNRTDLFGEQILMDSEDGVLGSETAFLAGATSVGIYDVKALAESFGAFVFPAHIDRPSFSLISTLGLWDPFMGFSLAELSSNCPPGFTDRPDLKGVRFITDCDAHYLDQIPDARQWMDVPDRTVSDILAWLKQP